MKKILFFLFFLWADFSNAQHLIKKDVCSDCKLDCLCKGFFKPYFGHQKLINKIDNNWNEFFEEDLETDFPSPKGVKTVSIKFDGMGCVYPSASKTLNKVKRDFLDPNIEDTWFYKTSFYSLFLKEKLSKGNERIREFITETGFNRKSFKEASTKGVEGTTIEYFDFIEKWNQRFLPTKVEEINQIVSSNNIKRIIIYIHGYNVPYSLAQLQGNVLLDSILSFEPTIQPSEILFVRLFWPSGDNKRHVLNAQNCDYSNIEGIPTIINYLYFSNRAYLAGIYTRRILREIRTDAPIAMITHSHGSTVATTALINTTSKLQRGDITKGLKKLIRNENLPTKHISVFLNAPSIPGKNTFRDINSRKQEYKNYHFFIGYNEHDLTLRKRRFKLFGKTVHFVSPTSKLSSTTLGCNWKNEVAKTVAVFKRKGLSANVKALENSKQEEHEFYCYLQQPLFKQNLVWYLNR